MKQEFDLYLKDILECINKIKIYTKEYDTFDKFRKSNITVDAVLNNLLIIGEASSQLQDWVKEKYVNVPWRYIIDFRNIGIHKYHSLNLERVWEILKTELDSLEKQISEIIEKENKK
jgi:uncharacterized protein with HEPN domain